MYKHNYTNVYKIVYTNVYENVYKNVYTYVYTHVDTHVDTFFFYTYVDIYVYTCTRHKIYSVQSMLGAVRGQSGRGPCGTRLREGWDQV